MALKVPSAGSVDNKLAMCAAEASKPSQSSGPSSDSSPISNPDHCYIRNKSFFNEASLT